MKEENGDDEDFVQLSAEYSACRQAVDVGNHCSIDYDTLKGTTTSTDDECLSLMLNVLDEVSELTDDSAELIERSIAHEEAIDEGNHHSIGCNTKQGSSTSTDEECSSLMLLAFDEVSELADDSARRNKHSVSVKKHRTIEASSSRGTSRSDDGENMPQKIPHKSRNSLTHPKKHPCTVCGMKFRFPKDVRRHMRIHTGEKPFSCSFCDRKFREKYHLDTHVLRHNNSLPQCDLCGGRFVALQKHMLTHSDASYKHTCAVCQKRFRTRYKLTEHMYTHSDERPFTCWECGGHYRSSTHLKKHMAVHTQVKNHVCNICGKKFSQHAGLNQHMRLHNGEKPFHCETCGKTFSQRVQLTYHLRTHTKDKPFICGTCGKGFIQPTALSRHELVHSGVQPYECSVCGMRFNQSSSMQRHMLTHTGEKPYSCSDCGQRFSQSGALATHRRRHCPAKQHSDVTEGDS